MEKILQIPWSRAIISLLLAIGVGGVAGSLLSGRLRLSSFATALTAATHSIGRTLRRGDVIQEVNRKAVVSVPQFEEAVGRGGNEPVMLLINRGGSTQFVVLESR